MATCSCWPPPAPIRSLSCSSPPRRRDLTSAHDQAAVIDWRIQDVNKVAAGGPLPWLPGIPHRIAADPDWGPYLNARSQPGCCSSPTRSAATPQLKRRPGRPSRTLSVPAELIADIQVWRAATQVDPSDLRPTGPPQLGYAARIFQQQLDKRLAAPDTNADEQWRRLLATEAPSATADPFLPELEERLTNLTRAGFDAALLVRSAAAAGPLPDDHPAAALWWRILDQLPETPNQEPCNPRRRPSDQAHDDEAIDKQPPRPRSAPPPGVRPEPLTRPPDAERRRNVRQDPLPKLTLICISAYFRSVLSARRLCLPAGRAPT